MCPISIDMADGNYVSQEPELAPIADTIIGDMRSNLYVQYSTVMV
jgi:hypothetical protein